MRNLLSLLALSACAVLCTSYHSAGKADDPKLEKIKALIIDGQNNHAWQKTTPVLKAALESSGLFTVDVATSPQDRDWSKFHPEFKKYDVVVSNYNGEPWPQQVRKDFEDYVHGEATRLAALLLMRLLCVVFAVRGIFAVAKLALGA